MIKVHVQIDIRLVRFMLAMLHLSVAGIAFLRHNMVDIFPGYAGFAEVGSTFSWGAVALAIGVGLLVLRKGTVLLILLQFASASYFTAFAILLSATNGLTWGTAAYLFPAVLSFIVMWNTLEDVFDNSAWMRAARDKIQDHQHV